MKYGLVGENGCGKTTFLRYLSSKELPGIPEAASVYHVEQEITKNEHSVLLNVLRADIELFELIIEESRLLKQSQNEETHQRVLEIYERYDEIDYYTAISRASKILAGLSFTEEMIRWPTNKFSGGWLMRISLAKALFCNPDILILDEPTNHLDFFALTWLENFLLQFEGTIIMVSHQIQFLNKICGSSGRIIVISDEKLFDYNGLYTSNIPRAFDNYDQLKSLQLTKTNCIEKYENFAKQYPESKNRMEKLIKIASNSPCENFLQHPFTFNSPSSEYSSNIIDVVDCSFSYDKINENGEICNEKNEIFKNIQFSCSSHARIALVGCNGCGKSTFIKLLNGDLMPDDGSIFCDRKLKISVFTQEFVDQLDLTKTPVEFLHSLNSSLKLEDIYKVLINFGLDVNSYLRPIKFLSGGQKSRLAFSKFSLDKPDILLLDEPTNHLDAQASTCLNHGLGLYEGAVIVVTHDELLIKAVCDEIYHIEDKKIMKWNSTINEYKKHVLKVIEEETKKRKNLKSIQKIAKIN